MSNMSYCRFENTLQDLRDCSEHLFEELSSAEEEKARDKLIALCRRIAADVDGTDGESDMEDRQT